MSPIFIRHYQLATVRVGSGSLSVLRYSPDAKWVAAVTSNGIELYNPLSQGRVGIIHPEMDAKAFAFSPNGMRMVIALSDNTIQIWSTEMQQPLNSIPPPKREVVEVWFMSKAGNAFPLLYAGLADGTVLRWRTSDWQPLKPIGGSHNKVEMIKFSPSGQHLAVLYKDHTIGFWHFTVRREMWVKFGTGLQNPIHLVQSIGEPIGSCTRR